MESQLTQSESKNTGRHLLSSGFYSFVLRLISFVLLAQLVRIFVLRSDFKIFYNEKFAFSLDVPITLIYFLYFVVFGLIFYYLVTSWDKLNMISKFGFGLIVAGGISNLIERIYFGYVTDYFFLFNGVLNLADVYIFLGAILGIIPKTNSEKFNQ